MSRLGLRAALFAFLVVLPVAAHPFSTSGFRVTPHDGGASLSLDIDARTVAAVLDEKIDANHDRSIDAAEMRAARDVVLDYLKAKLTIRNGSASCDFADAPRYELRENAGRIDVELEARCPTPWTEVGVECRALVEDAGGHRWITSIEIGGARHEMVLDAEHPAGSVPVGATAAQTRGPPSKTETPRSFFLAFLEQGTRHILSGVDHVLFIVALVLAVATFRNLVLVVTAFTLAHSVTLALGTIGVVVLPPRLVEPAIALTIAYVAAENAFRDEPRHRPWLAFAFGLVHGLAFSSVLRDLDLPRPGLVSALLSFNLGVEIGQLALVAVLFPLVLALRRREESYRRVRFGASVAIALVAAVWVVERAFDVKILSTMAG